MIEQLHLAAQYLATVQISFLDKKEDDSHTNLEFNYHSGRLETWPLNSNGLKLVLSYETFSLGWIDDENAIGEIFSLDGKNHSNVLAWLELKPKEHKLNGNYRFDLHYELPYELTDEYEFKISDKRELSKLKEQRVLINTVLEQVLKDQNLKSEIRVWPHHFDTGAYSVLPDSNEIAVGFGLALPDALIDDFYFYISGYKGHTAIDVSGFTSLSQGNWISKGFVGAVLSATKISKKTALEFFTEAICAYKA